ncbi:MAG: 3-phosphoshikimate 1-carboxyvinyltransferase [Candidatus Omnitrophota bacterium]
MKRGEKKLEIKMSDICWKIKKAEAGLKGELTVPPDKSISHRAVMFSALSEGTCRVENFLSGEDCLSTLNAFRALGTDITRNGGTVTVKGKGLKGLTGPSGELYLGNSGTTMRILSGILAGQSFSTVLTGDESLSGRPMRRIIDPLTRMGAEIESAGGKGFPPLKIKARSGPLNPVNYILPMASAQVKSCILSAGLYADGITKVTEPFQSRDHTERMLEYFSADIRRDGLTTAIRGLNALKPLDIRVPGDISSAAFFIVAALIVKGSMVILKNVGLNPTRVGLINVLKRMGGRINILDMREALEPAGDLEVRYSELHGTVVEEEEIPLLIDEIPVLTVAAARAEGDTLIKGIKELKVKETDRVKSISDNLLRTGVDIGEENDVLCISGNKASLTAAEFDSYGDHRIAMSMAVASLVSDGTCIIKNTACADTSYPGFFPDLIKVVG